MTRSLDLRSARLPALAPLGRRLLVPALGLVFGLGAVGCSGSTEFDPNPSQANPLDAEEDSLLYEANRFREENGNIAAALIVCKSLNVSASAHADDMRDKGYLTDKGQDGSTPRSRACAAGYTPACSDSAAMAEVVAEGFGDGKTTFPQWTMDDKTKTLLLNPNLTVVGVGRALLGPHPIWAMDLSSQDDPSCH